MAELGSRGSLLYLLFLLLRVAGSSHEPRGGPVRVSQASQLLLEEFERGLQVRRMTAFCLEGWIPTASSNLGKSKVTKLKELSWHHRAPVFNL